MYIQTKVGNSPGALGHMIFNMTYSTCLKGQPVMLNCGPKYSFKSCIRGRVRSGQKFQGRTLIATNQKRRHLQNELEGLHKGQPELHPTCGSFARRKLQADFWKHSECSKTLSGRKKEGVELKRNHDDQ